MRKQMKFMLAILLLLVAGTIFTYHAWVVKDIPYIIMGVGIIAAAIVIAIMGRGKKDKD